MRIESSNEYADFPKSQTILNYVSSLALGCNYISVYLVTDPQVFL